MQSLLRQFSEKMERCHPRQTEHTGSAVFILAGEYVAIAVALMIVVFLDGRYVDAGGLLSACVAASLLAFAAWLAFYQVRTWLGLICFLFSLPFFLYAWALGAQLSGNGI